MAKRQQGADGTSASRWRRSHRTGQNDGCQGNKGGDFPQGNTTRPLTDGREAKRQEKQGLSITGVWGEAPPQSQSAFEIKKKTNIIKNLDKPLYTGLFEGFV